MVIVCPLSIYIGFLFCMHTTMANDVIEKNWKKFLKCKECWEFKELSFDNWYKHSKWFMWVLWRCKECIKTWRKTEYERYMARIIDNNRYYNNPKRRDYIMETAKRRVEIKWYWRIHWITNNKISKLKCKPKICSVCWLEHKRIVAHHPDYSKRYEIVFCCPICHSKIHKWEIKKLNVINLFTF